MTVLMSGPQYDSHIPVLKKATEEERLICTLVAPIVHPTSTLRLQFCCSFRKSAERSITCAPYLEAPNAQLSNQQQIAGTISPLSTKIVESLFSDAQASLPLIILTDGLTDSSKLDVSHSSYLTSFKTIRLV